MTRPSDDTLEHYGVKGMKWGKRKARPTRSSKPASAAKPDNSYRALVKRAKIKQLDNVIEKNERIVNRKATGIDIFEMVSTTPILTAVLRGGDYSGMAKDKANTARAQRDRIASGKATLVEKMEAVQSVSVLELLAARK